MDAKISNTDMKFHIPSMLMFFRFNPSTLEEVQMYINQLSTSKSSGPENIPLKLYKLIAPIIYTYLSEIFNKCYEKKVFPSILKCAKVIPTYKAGKKNAVSNYRPVSILSPLAKIFKNMLYVRLEDYFSQNKIISNQQFGF